jgi:uncharacterized membrane protein YheB (UPF0754 family)
MSNKTNQQKALTDMTLEELQELKKSQLEQMQESMQYLEVEEKYTSLKAKIAENRLNEQVAKVKYATMMAPPPKQDEDESKGN